MAVVLPSGAFFPVPVQRHIEYIQSIIDMLATSKSRDTE